MSVDQLQRLIADHATAREMRRQGLVNTPEYRQNWSGAALARKYGIHRRTLTALIYGRVNRHGKRTKTAKQLIGVNGNGNV